MLLVLLSCFGFAVQEIQELYFEQRLDHYSPFDATTFKQRYFVNSAFYDNAPSSPLIVYLGGEGPFDKSYIDKDVITTVAKNTKALILALEHRFFGESLPFDYLNETSLKYLKVDQALADVETFITAKRREHCTNATCDVLVAGGSYSGSLASWFRLYYPHVANYSWASSAPLNIKASFSEFDESVASILKTVSENCFFNSKKLLSKYHTAITQNNEQEVAAIEERFGFPVDMDKTNMLAILAEIFSYATEYNDKYNVIESYCEKQKGETPSEDAFVDLFNDMITKMNTSVAELDDFYCVNESALSSCAAKRSWMWMKCNELGWFGTSAGFKSPWVNLSYYERVCQKLFSIGIGNITRVAGRYGGIVPHSSYVVFTHGTADPWAAAGVSRVDIEDAEFLWKIDGASHCSDMYSAKEDDSEALKNVRKNLTNKLSDWLVNKCSQKCHGRCLHDQCLCEVGWSGEWCTFRVVGSKKFWIVGMTALTLPLLILISVGGAAWWLFRKIQEQQFLLSLRY